MHTKFLVFLTVSIVLPLFLFSQPPGNEYQPTPPENQPEQQTFEISDEEVEKFVKAAEKAETLREESRQKMQELTEKYDIDINEYRQKQRMVEDPTRRKQMDEDELERIQDFGQELNDLQQEMDSKVRNEVKEAGLDMQRYQQILSALQRDDELEKKIMDKMNEMEVELN